MESVKVAFLTAVMAMGLLLIMVSLYVFFAIRQAEVVRVTNIDGSKFWSIETTNDTLINLIK
jgi:hypothetical protein